MQDFSALDGGIPGMYCSVGKKGDAQQEMVCYLSVEEGEKILYLKKIFAKSNAGDFPRGPVGKAPCYQCWGPGFDPWSGN